MQTQLAESITGLNKSVDSLAKFAEKSILPLDTCREDEGVSMFLKSGTGAAFTKSISVAEGGGFLMPNNTCKHIYEKIEELSPIRSLVNVIKISTESLEVLVDKKAPEAAWSSELKYPIESSDPELKKIKIQVHEVFSRLKATQKLLEDSSVDIYSWFVTKISEQIAKVEDHAFLLGDGVGKPKGILKYPTDKNPNNDEKFQHFVTGKNGAFKDDSGADVLINVLSSLKREFMKNSVWLMSRSAYCEIQKLKLRNSGQYVWQPPLTSTTSSLFGYPIIIDDNMPELTSSSPTNSIIFGNFAKAYQVVDRTGINVFRDPYSSKPFVEFCATKRTGGNVINFEALKIVRFGE